MKKNKKVKVEGNWYLIDTTWDAGYLNGRSFTARYRTVYLFINPYNFIHSHFPLNPDDQLLSTPMSAEDFLICPGLNLSLGSMKCLRCLMLGEGVVSF
jgi:transglutaminase/protease-like cytokinesis protein 3